MTARRGSSRPPSAAQAAVDVGFPVMLKASAGGGGKGMRVVRHREELAAAFRAASSEAQSSFGDGSVYVEKFVEGPRHVEIQILGDNHGNVVSLGERECSLQRRHQKVVEEAPSTVVDPALRRRMGESAVKAARAVDYVGAGTVEFLLDSDGEFYFLEMNTRLQVEHPVTELVTGVDLVMQQILIAEGHSLPAGLDSLEPRGHAIEVRLYAEDPYRNFAPSPGTIETLRLPEGPGVRNDCGVYQGSEVTIHYDPLLAKLIVWGPSRERALHRLRRALKELIIDGVRTTAPLYLDLLQDEDFLQARMDIGMLDRKLDDGSLGPGARDGGAVEADALASDLPLLAAAIAHVQNAAATNGAGPSSPDRAAIRARENWRVAARRDSRRAL